MDIFTLATIPAVLAVVQFLKQFGVTGKMATLAAVLTGIVFTVADYAFTTDPATFTPNGWYTAVGGGLILGLGAAGLYDAANLVRPDIAVIEGFEFEEEEEPDPTPEGLVHEGSVPEDGTVVDSPYAKPSVDGSTYVDPDTDPYGR